MAIDTKALSAYLAQAFEKSNLAGVSVAIAGPDGIEFDEGYGIRDAAGTIRPDGDTMYGIASMSKSMTALACAILADAGKLRLDAPVSDFFPTFRLPGIPRDAVTVMHLVTHSAGIPPMEPLEWSIAMNSKGRMDETTLRLRAASPNQMDSIEQIIDYISAGPYGTLGEPGQYMSYSNEGYALLSYLVDQAAGIPLEDFLKQHVWGPLGMTRTVMDVDCATARAHSGGNITSLFEMVDGKRVCDDDWSVLPPFRGCAMVKSTARDMAIYYRALANGGMHNGRQVLPAGAVERMIGRGFPVTTEPVYCMGLYKRLRAGQVMLEHYGGLHGVSSHGLAVLGAPGAGYGIACLCNQGEADVDPISAPMLNAVQQIPLDTKLTWLTPAGRDFQDPEMLVGDYLAHEGVPDRVQVRWENGKLTATRESGHFTLVYAGNMWFMGFLSDDHSQVNMRAQFYVHDGKAWAAKFGTRIFPRV